MACRLVALAVCAGFISACMSTVVQNPNPTGDELAIVTARTAQNDAISTGAFDDVATFWTEDITVRTGLGMVFSGRGEYRAAFDSSTVYVRETERVELSDRWPVAWEEGTWVGRRRADGKVMISGRYAAQWVKSDGVWKIRSEVFVALECSADACSWPVAK